MRVRVIENMTRTHAYVFKYRANYEIQYVRNAPNEPTTAVVRGGKHSLRARITAEGGCLKRDLRAGSVCLYVCMSVRYCDVT